MVKRREGNRAGEAKLITAALEKLASVQERTSEVFLGVRLDALMAQIRKRDTLSIVLDL